MSRGEFLASLLGLLALPRLHVSTRENEGRESGGKPEQAAVSSVWDDSSDTGWSGVVVSATGGSTTVYYDGTRL